MSSTMGPGVRDRRDPRGSRGQALGAGRTKIMAVTRADKETELSRARRRLQGRRRGDPARLQGHQRAPGHRAAPRAAQGEGGLPGGQEHAGRRALKGTTFETLTAHFEGTTAVAFTEDDPVALAKTLTAFMKNAPTLQIKAAVVQGQAIKPAEVTELANLPGKPELYATAAVRAAGPGDQPGARAERGAARPDERARAGGAEAQGIVGTEPDPSTTGFLRSRVQWPK